MNERGLITATMHELERIKVIEAVCEHRLTMVRAAERLGLCERQISRLARCHVASGPVGLISGKRGQPSNRELRADLRSRAMALVRERYVDFGPTLACEKLRECHGIALGKETVRRWMRDAGLWIPRKQRPPRLRQPRNRRSCLGGCAIFEPAMLATVDLNQFAQLRDHVQVSRGEWQAHRDAQRQSSSR
jgi:hypothetical protein